MAIITFHILTHFKYFQKVPSVYRIHNSNKLQCHASLKSNHIYSTNNKCTCRCFSWVKQGCQNSIMMAIPWASSRYCWQYHEAPYSTTVSVRDLENSDVELWPFRIIPQTPAKIPLFMTNYKPVMSNLGSFRIIAFSNPITSTNLIKIP